MAIDMWSLGCILAELYTGYALLPGEDEADQLACIIELFGMPPAKLLAVAKRAKNFISAKGYPRYCSVETLDDGTIKLGPGLSRRGKERKPPGGKELKTALNGCDDNLFLNFLRGCLEWDPELRMTPATALKHSWFRRRLPRPPHFTSTINISSSSPSNNIASVVENNKGTTTSLHIPAQNSSTTNHHNNHHQQQHSMSSSTSRSSNKTTNNHLINNSVTISSNSGASGSSGISGGSVSGAVNSSGGLVFKSASHKVTSFDEMILAAQRAPTTTSVDKIKRYFNSGTVGAPKLPQIQQGNTVT